MLLNRYKNATEKDISQVREQLGRVPRGMVGVGYMANGSALDEKLGVKSGEVVVVVTSPRVESRKSVNTGGNTPLEPFPTLFYLTHPLYASALSRLEADGYMKLLQDLITPESEYFNEKLLIAYKEAHTHYIRLRDDAADELGVERLTSTHADFSAGGMPERVKCIHALLGYTLATYDTELASCSNITLTDAQAEHVLLRSAQLRFNSACPIGDIVYAKLMLY